MSLGYAINPSQKTKYKTYLGIVKKSRYCDSRDNVEDNTGVANIRFHDSVSIFPFTMADQRVFVGQPKDTDQ